MLVAVLDYADPLLSLRRRGFATLVSSAKMGPSPRYADHDLRTSDG